MTEYKKIEKEDLKRIIENHKHYLNRDCENWQSMKADLSNVDLSSMNLSCINLQDAKLIGAKLVGADLSETNLKYANLFGANLTSADLFCANLRYANLEEANLYKAYLLAANLKNARMFKANLEKANLKEVDLSDADLRYANLQDADLSNIDDLEGTNLYHAKISDQYKIKGEILTQDIIGYKKCRYDVIVTLKIPRGAIVFSINGKKCRTNKVIVLDIEDMDGNKVNRALSKYKYMSYYVGDVITDYTFNCQYNVECSNGIHFFRTKEEAENY